MEREEAVSILTAHREMAVTNNIVVKSREDHMVDCHGGARQYGDLTDEEKRVYDAFTLAISALWERDGTAKIVIVKHFGDNGHYLFSVPKGRELKEGDSVIVKNKRGDVAAKCVSGSFEVGEDVLKALAAKYGATLPLAQVIGVMKPEWW